MRDNIFEIIAHALLAAFGAMARQMSVLQKKPLSPRPFIYGCIIAAFMGVIIYFLAENLSINQNVAYALAGLSGWIGPHILDGLAKQVIQSLGIKTEEEDEQAPEAPEETQEEPYASFPHDAGGAPEDHKDDDE